MFRLKLSVSLTCILLFLGCASTSQLQVPDELMAVYPRQECQEEFASPDAWNIKALLKESGEKTYLVIYFNPPYESVHEPFVELHAGIAVYEGKKDDRYYYQVGKLPKGKRIGKFIFETGEQKLVRVVDPKKYPEQIRNRNRYQHVDVVKEYYLERSPDSNCLRVVQPLFSAAH